MNIADLVVLSIICAIVALIVHGMMRGTIKTCDSASCAGNCAACGHVCATPRITLSEEQLEQLRELDQKGSAS